MTTDHSKYARNKRQTIGGHSFTLHRKQEVIERAHVTKVMPELLQKKEQIILEDYNENMKILGTYWEVKEDQKVDVIKNDTFANLKKLKKLFICQLDLESLEPHAFRGLKNLEELSLYRNKLTSLPVEIFTDLPNLVALNLDDNKISEIDPHLFDNLNKLEDLTMAINKLTSLPSDWARGLSNLKGLSLNTNQFQVLKSGMFEGLNNLQSLRLDVNQMQEIEKDAFKGLDALTDLSMIYNRTLTGNLVEELDHLKNLKSLSISRDSLDPEQVDSILQIAESRDIDFCCL